MLAPFPGIYTVLPLPLRASPLLQGPAGSRGHSHTSQPLQCWALTATHQPLLAHSRTLMPCLEKGRCKRRKKKSKTPAPHWEMGIIFSYGEDQESLSACSDSPHCLGKPLWCQIALVLLGCWLFEFFLFPCLSRLICPYFNWDLTFLVLATWKLLIWKVPSMWNILLYSTTVFVQVLFTRFFCA